MASTHRQEPIAIVGAGCRFPGGIGSLDDFWRLLAMGGSVIGTIPEERWDRVALHSDDPAQPGKMNCSYGGFLEDVAGFDADFFGITPREAKQLDPQQRLLLEVCWESLGNAGVPPSSLAGTRTSVHTGAISNDYLLMHNRAAGLPGIDPWYATGKEFSFGPGRIAHLLGTSGPAFSLNAACASSLVGVELACQGLRAGDTDLGLVAAASLMLSPELSMFMSKVGAIAPDGRCKVFDAHADGTVRGEGAAAIVLKRLSDAVADRDRIIAVIRGTAVNHNGHSAGLTVPSGAAQRALIEAAVRRAGVAPQDIDYLEAHGTGTALGDPIEMGAAAAALTAGRTDPLLVGSVKTNLGHTDTVAGLAGLLKTALVLDRGHVPAHLHLSEPHPGIRWDVWPVAVPTEQTSLPNRPDRPRLAGVSAFGLSGTNAHVVLEQAPQPRRAHRDRLPEWHILPLSARRPAALAGAATRHHAALGALSTAEELTDYTQTAGRFAEHYDDQRACVIGRSAAELRERLTELADDLADEDAEAPRPSGVVFVCSGQGRQWAGMARSLRQEPAFGAALAEVDALVRERAGWSVLAELDSDAPRYAAETAFAQPVIFAVQVALAAQWRAWGIVPDAVIGHSMGEVAAAHLGGALTLSDAVDVIVERGRVLAAAHGKGRMLAAEMPAAAARERCTGQLRLAAVNAPDSCVFSGPPDEIEALRERLTEAGVRARTMPGEYAFHHPALAPYAARLAEAVAHIRPGEPETPVAATTRPAAPVAPFTAEYWAANVVEPVSFAAGIDELDAQGHQVFVELGPHPVLQRPLAACLAGRDALITGALRTGTDARQTMLGALGQLYSAGLAVDWSRVGVETGERAVLPTYPWQREHFWFDAVPGRPADPVSVPSPPPAAEPRTTPARRPAEPARADLGSAEDMVADAVGEVLGIPAKRVRRSRGFAEMGMDSLTAVALTKLLSQRLGRELGATTVFDYPTVRRLAAHLGPQLPAVAQEAPAEDAPADGAPTHETPAEDTPAAETPVRSAPDSPAPESDMIAVVGMGCRLPGGVFGPDDLWRLLGEGTDAVGAAPPDRFDDPGEYPGGYLDDVYDFDARFFRVPPKEAKVMDPQHRLFLEVAWESLEDAGITAPALQSSRTGVFVGMNSHDYAALASADPQALDGYYGTGNSFSGSAGRLSYFLGAHGPNLAVDTACSSSLVGVHLAVRSLRSGESDLAIAGGVNLMLRSTIHRSSEALGALSPTGRCKSFDESADGYIRGEGCGVVVLKRLSDALADGDRVHAVLLGTAVNSDGASSGLTVPNGLAQQQVLRDALADGGADPARIDYVEAHGTGTALGDPIELRALGAVLDVPGRDGPCLVGSVKANIGHLEAASGMAGLIKAILVAGHASVPPNPHFTTPSSKIPWDELPLRVATGPTPLAADRARLAGVSSFGFTGTNAHVVLRSYEPAHAPAPGETRPGTPLALPVSAPTRSGLAAQARTLLDHLVTVPEDEARDVCFTAARYRTHFEHRAVALGNDREELLGALGTLAGAEQGQGVQVTGTVDGEPDPGPVFVCSGHGGYWTGAGAELYREEKVFAAAVDRCSAALLPHLGWSVADRIAAGEEVADEADQQALVFAIQVALAELWAARGVRPAAVVGHSMGEVAAARIAGALDLESAARLMALRCRQIGKLMGNGGMALIGLDAERTEAEIAEFADRLWVSVTNSSASTVVSGDNAAIETVLGRLRARNIFCRRVNSGGAGHCPLVEDLANDLVAEVDWLRPHRPEVAFYSPVTGRREEDLGARYWGRNVRDRVRFDAAVRALAADGLRTFVELSVHPLLATAIEQELTLVEAEGVVVGSLSKGRPERAEFATNAARLHVRGRAVDLAGLHPAARRVPLPRYAWEHRPYRLDGADTAPRRTAGGQLLASCDEFDGVWLARSVVDEALLAATGAHRHGTDAVCPPGALLAMAFACGRQWRPATALTLEQVRFADPLIVGAGQAHTAQVALRPAADDARVVVRSAEGPAGEGLPRTRLTARLRTGGDLRGPDTGPEGTAVTLAEEDLTLPDGLRITEARDIPDGLVLAVDAAARQTGHAQHHPLAVCLRAVALAARHCGAAAGLEVAEADTVTVAAHAGDPRAARWTVRVRGLDHGAGRTAAEVTLHDEHGGCLVRATGVRLARPRLVPLDSGERSRLAAVLHREVWRPAPAVEPAQQPESAGPWLIVGDPDGLGSALQERLARHGAEAELLTAPDKVGEVVAGRLRGAGLGTVVHLAAIGRRGHEDAAVVATVPELAGASAATAARTGPRCFYVTQGAYPEQRGAADPVQRAVWTTARRCAVEFPRSWGGLIDLDPAERDRHTLADQILAETAAAGGEDHVCLRGRTRSVRRVATLPEPPSVRAPLDLSPEATYLIADAGPTEATALAGWLAERGARNLLLCGPGQVQAEQSGLDALRAYGVDIRCERLDLADPTAVAALVHVLNTEGRPVRGAVWAGVDWRIGEARREERPEEAMRRATGAWNLHERCAQLDLFVVFSTAASCWGARDIGAQAAADGMLRALVDQRAAGRLPVTGVAWAPWEGAEGLDAATVRTLGRVGISPLAVDDAIATLDHLVATGAGATTVVDADRSLLVSMYAQAGTWPLFTELAEELHPDTEDPAGELARLDPELRAERLVSAVCAELAVVLGVDDPGEIEPDEGFFALGLNSVGALELRVRLQRGFGIALPSTVAFEHPTPVALAAQLATLLGLDGPDAPDAPPASGPPATEPPATGTPPDGTDTEDLIARFEREMASAETAIRREN